MSTLSRPFVSVVVTTYNSPGVLSIVLSAFARQSRNDFEVIVADDGSGDETREILDSWKSCLGVPLTHAWQPDEGFRLSRARNLGAQHAKGELLIFLDGDCVVGPRFIEEHQKYCIPGWYTVGSRVLYGKQPTRRLLQSPPKHGLPSKARLIFEGIRGRAMHFEQMFLKRNRRPGVADLGPKNPAFLFSIWSRDFERVNGFDNRFQGWGLEDLEFFVRLQRSGLKSGVLGRAATVLHLWHEDSPRPTLKKTEPCIKRHWRPVSSKQVTVWPNLRWLRAST